MDPGDEFLNTLSLAVFLPDSPGQFIIRGDNGVVFGVFGKFNFPNDIVIGIFPFISEGDLKVSNVGS